MKSAFAEAVRNIKIAVINKMEKKIQDQFVPADIAEALKEIRFNEPCLGLFNRFSDTIFHLEERFYKNSDLSPEEFTAPLWQQVVDWLEEVHDMQVYYTPYNFGSCLYSIKTSESLIPPLFHNTKKEALTYAIKEAINIVKNQ